MIFIESKIRNVLILEYYHYYEYELYKVLLDIMYDYTSVSTDFFLFVIP